MSKKNIFSNSSKGDFGYLSSEKKRRILITSILFAVPLLIFFTALLYFHTRLTIWTVVAVVGCLPACKSLVSLIMIFRARPLDASVYKKISQHAGKLTMSYEMYMTFYEKNKQYSPKGYCYYAWERKESETIKSSLRIRLPVSASYHENRKKLHHPVHL